MTGMSGVVRDERTVVVEDASYRFAYIFITYALLLEVCTEAWTDGRRLGICSRSSCRRGGQ